MWPEVVSPGGEDEKDLSFLDFLHQLIREEHTGGGYFTINMSNMTNHTSESMVLGSPAQRHITHNPEKILALILGTISVIANLCSLVAITRVRGVLTANLRLIVSLCIGDMMTCISILLFIGHSEMSVMLGLGNTFTDTCVLTFSRSLRITSHVISLLNLVGLALDHYLAILRPLDYPSLLCRSRANAMILVFWIVAFLCGFSNFYILFSSYSHCQDAKHFCEVVFCNTYDSEYIMFAMALFSLILMSVLYTRIYMEIHRYQSFQQEHTTRPNVRRNRRGLVTTFFIVLTFLLCWLPYSLFEVIILTEMTVRPHRQFYYFKLAATIDTYLYDVLLLNCLCDPIIYAMRMREVQHGYRASVQHCMKRKQALKRRFRGIDRRSSSRNSSHTLVLTSISTTPRDSFL